MRRVFLSLLLAACLAPARPTRRPAPRPQTRAARAAREEDRAGGGGLPVSPRQRREHQARFLRRAIGRTPADGIAITIPPHKGTTVLTFDLHNRMTYSEDLVRAAGPTRASRRRSA